MAKSGYSKLEFPVGGLNRRYGYQSQPPYTTPDCLNVRPRDVLLGRGRGGTRPGLAKAYTERVEGDYPVNMLANVSAMDRYHEDYEPFDGTALSAAWTASSIDLPSIASGKAYNIGSAGPKQATHAIIPGYDTTKPVLVQAYIEPYASEHYGEYCLGLFDAGLTYIYPGWLRYATTNGFLAALTLDSTGAYSGYLYGRVASTWLGTKITFSDPGTDGSPQPGWFTILYTPGAYVTGPPAYWSNTIKVYWNNHLIHTDTTLAVPSYGYNNYSFGLVCTSALTAKRAQISTVRSRYHLLNGTECTHLVAAANGRIYRDGNIDGSLLETTSTKTVNTTQPVQATEYYQKLYIADHGETILDGTDGTFRPSTRHLTATGISDWTTLGIDVNKHVCYLYSCSTGTIINVYGITSVEASQIHLAGTSADTTDYAVSYRILPGPKIYDTSADTLTDWLPTYGIIPTACNLICKYRDRIVLAGDKYTPQLWYMSRMGDPLDWDYSEIDSGAAVAGNVTDTGSIGQPITALVPHSDDYLIFGCQNELWVLSGDARSGGVLDNISYVVGIIDAGAWCYGPAKELIFLSADGVYILNGTSLTSVSREQLPQELLNIDLAFYQVLLKYDIKDRGVHIYVTPYSETDTAYQYWLDWETKSFWPVSHSANHQATAIIDNRSEDTGVQGVVLGCRDGYLRKYSGTATTDDGTAFNGSVLYGPVMLWDEVKEGLIAELIGTAGTDSNSLTWEIYTSDTGQGATAAAILGTTPTATGTFTAGQNYTARPRTRGRYMVLKLKSASSAMWIIETIMAKFLECGKSRKL